MMYIKNKTCRVR